MSITLSQTYGGVTWSSSDADASAALARALNQSLEFVSRSSNCLIRDTGLPSCEITTISRHARALTVSTPDLSRNRKLGYWVPGIIGLSGSVALMPLRSRKELSEQFF